jgi:hypothetical protein
MEETVHQKNQVLNGVLDQAGLGSDNVVDLHLAVTS